MDIARSMRFEYQPMTIHLCQEIGTFAKASTMASMSPNFTKSRSKACTAPNDSGCAHHSLVYTISKEIYPGIQVKVGLEKLQSMAD